MRGKVGGGGGMEEGQGAGGLCRVHSGGHRAGQSFDTRIFLLSVSFD